jgi:hypothetical protein
MGSVHIFLLSFQPDGSINDAASLDWPYFHASSVVTGSSTTFLDHICLPFGNVVLEEGADWM